MSFAIIFLSQRNSTLGGSLKCWQGSGWFCRRFHFFIKASFIRDTKGWYCATKGNISFSCLLFCFRISAFLPVSFTANSNCVASLCPSSAFEIWNTSSEEFVRRIFKASRFSNRRFNNWWMIRGENVYTVRFPFEMRLYVKDSFFSFFCWLLCLSIQLFLKRMFGFFAFDFSVKFIKSVASLRCSNVPVSTKKGTSFP